VLLLACPASSAASCEKADQSQRLAAVGQQREEPVVDEAGQRQRHMQGFGCGEQQAMVFRSQRSAEAGGLEFLVGD
jgi:hypothetical protein